MRSTLGAALALCSACELTTEIPVDYGPMRSATGAPSSNALPRDPLIGVNAPDETTIRVASHWLVDGAEDPGAYAVTSAFGDLEILGATVDDDATVWLKTSPQKLGVHYTLHFEGGDYGFAETFPSADRTTLWATAIGQPDVGQMELEAKRVAIGEHVVIYVEKGMSIGNADQVITHFDERIYPVETDLFNAAPDRDGNGRILLFGVDGGASFGGYFSVVNAATDAEAMSTWGRHSNEMEMLYVNVASGMMNVEVVIPHELAHLLYHESHDPTVDWAYQNEGLAECAVHAVNGGHPKALNHYLADPTWTIRDGLSLVQWTNGNCPQYAQAYVFWTYLAGQLGGVEGFGELFALSGDPGVVDGFLQDRLGLHFDEAQLNALIASWVQAPTGLNGFNGLLQLDKRPHVATTTTLDLAPFAGAFLLPSETTVAYTGEQGPDVVFVGIDEFDTIDLESPFEVGGGVLVALNTSSAIEDPAAQPTGLLPATTTPSNPPAAIRDPSWWHPPPFDPRHLERTLAWQRRTAPPP